MKTIHISDYYHTGRGYALNNVVERLAKKQHIEVYTSNKNLLATPFDDSKLKFKIIRFRGIELKHKVFFLGAIPKLLLDSPDIIHSYVMGFYSTFITGYLRKIKNFKMVLFSDFNEETPLPKTFVKKLLWNLFVKIPSKSADVITVFTSSQKKYISKLLDYPLEKIKIVPSGVDFKLFQTKKTKEMLRKQLNLPSKKFIIINVGNFGEKRNYELLVNILKDLDLKNVLFIHFGSLQDKKYYKKINKLIQKNKLNENIKLFGEKDLKEIIPYHQASDLFLQTSKNETFGIPLIEAMTSGLPVVTTKEGVVEDAIKNGENGFVIKNKKEGVKAINKLYKNKKLRNKVGIAAKKTAKEFDWEKIVEKVERIYATL